MEGVLGGDGPDDQQRVDPVDGEWLVGATLLQCGDEVLLALGLASQVAAARICPGAVEGQVCLEAR